jgi:hypothetical protein
LIQFASVREALGIQMPAFNDLAIIFGFGVMVFISMEILKFVLRKKMALR